VSERPANNDDLIGHVVDMADRVVEVEAFKIGSESVFLLDLVFDERPGGEDC